MGVLAEGSLGPVADGRPSRVLSQLRLHGASPISFLSLARDKSIFFGSVEGFLAYRKLGPVRVVLGDPVASRSEASTLLRDFVHATGARSSPVVAIAVTEEGAEAYAEAGFRGFPCGSEAVVDLSSFDLTSPRRRNLRRSARHASVAGVVVTELAPSILSTDGFAAEFRGITSDWLDGRKTDLLSFIVGEPFMPGWRECRHFVARSSDRMEAFVILYPIFARQAFYADITRRRRSSPNGTMDLLLSQALLRLAREGIPRVYLGMVPGVLRAPERKDPMVRLVRFAYRHLNAVYPMTSEFFFKEKFAPIWEPRFAFFHPRMSVSSLTALYKALWPHGTGGILRHKLRR